MSTKAKKTAEVETDPPPECKVKCVNSKCSEVGIVKVVTAGIVVGDKVLMYGAFSCMVCGTTLSQTY